jgi:hypothetical protein
MRKIILVAAMVLVSASAHAGDRSLSMAPASEKAVAPQTAATPATATAQVGEPAPATVAPKYVDRPPVVSNAAPAAATTTTSSTPTATRPAPKRTARASKPKHKPYWSERRIIAELHRHGIYW